MSVKQEDLSRVKNSPLSSFLNEILVECSCGHSFTVKDTLEKTNCSSCNEEIFIYGSSR